ncbi:HPP family protein [Haloarcula onubensis]|uniref:CBS domain-containing protein n=1 Tax=Haloarcula onubensis TaxID=2950539 RepID=A0ABU2FKB4_9EURY|nr:CBS domain-containing protein [Halomicroarcula sp. S3CR25-11]MDS0281191.1 CBS domain-containing protein [Halomicroarcula sp. S3CR25-11]
MDDIFVGSLMTSPVTTVPADTPAKDAAELMLEAGISSVVVVDDNDRLVGILTSTDFVAIAAAEDSAAAFSVADHMTTDVVTTTAGASIEAVANLLIEHGIHHVPVVDDAAGVVGMVTTTDLTAYLAGGVDSESTRAWT